MPFTNTPWDAAAVSRSLNAADYCECCLFDLNPPGKEKIKGLCKGPLRATPSGPYNTNAIRNMMGRIFQTQGIPADKKRKGAKRLISLAREAGVAVGSAALYRLAGMKPPK
jgi:hypothetical protein